MKLKAMGVTRKEMEGPHSTPEVAKEGEYEKQKVYPELSVSGKHAEMLGAADLKVGDLVKMTGEFEVKSLRYTDENGTERYEMTLCLKKAECEACEKSEDEDDEEKSDDDETSDNPGLEYLKKYGVGSD